MENIYSDGTYIKQHPTLHEEDSAYKFARIRGLLDQIRFDEPVIRVVDIGGGNGAIGLRVAEYFSAQGKQVEFTALDMSADMLAQQKRNNPHIKEVIQGSMQALHGRQFDLALMIDVIEHIPEKEQAAQELNSVVRYVVYNIPIELNVLDRLRNLYMGNRYYALQTASLGHVHFFSVHSAKRFIKQHHRLMMTRFSSYAGHILTHAHPNYAAQRAHALRRAELKFSDFMFKWLPWLAPFVVQGSLFVLAARKDSRG